MVTENNLQQSIIVTYRTVANVFDMDLYTTSEL